MRPRSIKKFYQTVSVAPEIGGFVVMLDAHALRTPSRANLGLPQALAEAVAEEWRSQGEFVMPDAMPLTRIVNTAVDHIGPQREIIIEQVLGFGRSDTICYRTEAPVELTAMQEAAWDPWLIWAERHHGARLKAGEGIGFLDQPEASLASLKAAIAAHDDFALTALTSAAGVTRSLVLGLALSAGEIDAEKAFRLSRIDEDFQAARWGRDAEAEQVAEALKAELESSERLFRLLKS